MLADEAEHLRLDRQAVVLEVVGVAEADDVGRGSTRRAGAAAELGQLVEVDEPVEAPRYWKTFRTGPRRACMSVPS